ncbi:MAG: AMP-binding protein, partial [Haloechinothrix sp.]
MAGSICAGTVPWPDQAVARYVAAGYWEGHPLGWHLWWQADRSPDRIAFTNWRATGLPKLIARTHDDYAYNAKRSGEVCGFDADTSYLVALPAGRNFPLACPGILGTLLVGGRVVMLPTPEPARAFEWIERERITHRAATTGRRNRTPRPSPRTAGTAAATSAGCIPAGTSSSRAGT